MEKNENSLTHRDINVCDDQPAQEGDPITWHNLRGFPVQVHFDTPDGCPLDECHFPVPAHGTHDNNVKANVPKVPYHYRVEPECGHLANPKIIIQ
jgi:DsbC/DsbD-like thiol-disulfide interchange protein